LALPKINALGIKTKRPGDYFAEMAKSDEHMKRVREKILSKHAELEKKEKVRKLRELKKIGKQIQIETEKKKQQAKKKLNEAVKKYQKGENKEDLEIELKEDDHKPENKQKAAKEANTDSSKKKSKDNGKK
jgi:rRNA-processing protein EBP2